MTETHESEALRAALEQFVYDNPELERLEAILDNFNPFVALRWTRQELRHSSFLRWLLDPTETHGLGPYFLCAFWKRIAHRSLGSRPQAPTVVDVDSWDLSNAAVMQEWHGIDLLVLNDTNLFVGVIENKIDTFEHSEQLQRYRRHIEGQFPHHMKLFAYLSVNGEIPSDETYAPMDYSEIVTLVDDTLNRRGDQLSPDVRSFLGHYVEMVRRHIVEDSEIQELCRVIYGKHRKALDVLFEHRPDRASDIRDILVELIQTRQQLIQDHTSKSYVRFLPKNLDFLARVGEGWTPSKRLLLFEFENYNNGLSLKLVLGPGEQELRDRVHRLISDHPKVFNRAQQKLYPKWWSCHIEKWLGPKEYNELDLPGVKAEIERRLGQFLEERLPKIEEILTQLRQKSPVIERDT